MGEPVASPCIKVCCVEPQSGLCLGCFRTLPEIARWGRMDDGERERVTASLAGRASLLPVAFRPNGAV